MDIDSPETKTLKRARSPDDGSDPLDLGHPESITPKKRAVTSSSSSSSAAPVATPVGTGTGSLLRSSSNIKNEDSEAIQQNRRITRQAAAHAASNENAEKRMDPFDVLSDDVVRMIIFMLPNTSIVALRRVSRLWKGYVEFVVTAGFLERKYGNRAVTKKLKEEEKLGWPEFAFRKNAFLDHAFASGAPTSVKKFTKAHLWELVGERLVWIDESSNLNVQHLSAWDVHERKDSLVALAGNPRALAKNKFLHSVIADQQRKGSAERPKRASKKEKIPEAIIIRWSLNDTLKTRRTKIKVNFMAPYGDSRVLLDYFQSDDNGPVVDRRFAPRFMQMFNGRNKLACINVVTGYAEWNVHLEDLRLVFLPVYRYQCSWSSYLIYKDTAFSFTSPDRTHNFGVQTADRTVFLTVRNLKTGAVIDHKEIKEISDVTNSTHYPSLEHSVISPDGKYIILSIARKLWICSGETYEFVQKVEMPWLQDSIIGARYDLEFNEDGSRLFLTEECNGHDFNVIELDCNDGFKPVFIRSYHLPTKTSFISRTSFNHRTQTMVLITRSSIPMSGEWRPEVMTFISMEEHMQGIPPDLWAARWREGLGNGYEKWQWAGPSSSGIPQPPLSYDPGSNAYQLALLIQAHSTANFLGPGGTGNPNPLAAAATALGLSLNQLFGTHAPVSENSTLTPRGRIFLETPRMDYVMVSKNAVTLPPLVSVQPNALQDSTDDSGPSTEWRGTGVCFTGPALTRKRGSRAPRNAVAVREALKHDRREWWIGGRMNPFKVQNGERFILFDQDTTLYCCDFGPVGW